ncbi:MAG: iron-containing alcohol dehydrogenase [Infirmifilum sp.]
MTLMTETTPFNLWLPTRIIFRRGAIETIGQLASKHGRKAIVITGRTFARKYGYDAKIRQILEESGLTCSFFSDVEPNPTYTTIRKAMEVASKVQPDVIVAFGGGSVIDAAKALNVVYTLGGSIEDYVYPKTVDERLTPLIAIPTTHGTGSEVTKYSVLVDETNKMKIAVSGDGIYPDYAVLDPLVLNYLPRDQSASTGLDALSHAIEAYFSRRSNPYSDLLALEAAGIIFRYLPCAVTGLFECREKVFYASMLAGIAINYSGTNLGHGLGYALTVELGLPHGLANAMILPGAARFYEGILPAKSETFYLKTGVARPPGGLEEAIQRLKASVGAPLKLRDLGVRREQLEHYVKEGLRYQRNLANAPLDVSESIVRSIFEAVY